MKKINSLVIAIALGTSAFAGSAFAREDGPCRQIKESCESAGFKKGDHKANGKGLYVDCMKKIMNGESVPGVAASGEQVAACKAKKAEHAAKKKSA